MLLTLFDADLQRSIAEELITYLIVLQHLLHDLP